MTEILDLSLIGSVCSIFVHRIKLDALYDCVNMLVESVTGMDAKKAMGRWEDWLDKANIWPVLANELFPTVISDAVARIASVLTKEGCELDREMSNDLTKQIKSLTLRDMISPSGYESHFPDRPTETGEETEES